MNQKLSREAVELVKKFSWYGGFLGLTWMVSEV